MDVDIGVKVKSWEDVQRWVDALLSTNDFEQSQGLQFRFRHTNGILIDVVPFGQLENPAGMIQWPTDEKVMSTIGFDDAFESSMVLQLRREPALDVRICTPPGMVILKLIAWSEKYPERPNDAVDIRYVLETYLDAGNDVRLHTENRDLLEIDDFDYVKRVRGYSAEISRRLLHKKP